LNQKNARIFRSGLGQTLSVRLNLNLLKTKPEVVVTVAHVCAQCNLNRSLTLIAGTRWTTLKSAPLPSDAPSFMHYGSARRWHGPCHVSDNSRGFRRARPVLARLRKASAAGMGKCAMKTRAGLALFEYWMRVRKSAPMPSRRDIEPADIGPVLTHTFMLHAPRLEAEMTFRLAGSSVSALFGDELRGAPLNALLPGANIALVRRLLRTALSDGNVVVLELDGATAKNRNCEIEAVFLPLTAENGEPRILGAAAVVNPPFWVGAEPIATASISSFRMIRPDKEPIFLANRPAIAVPPIAPDAASVRRLTPRGVQFRVIDGGREG
jgi:hypothetical protein